MEEYYHKPLSHHLSSEPYTCILSAECTRRNIWTLGCQSLFFLWAQYCGVVNRKPNHCGIIIVTPCCRSFPIIWVVCVPAFPWLVMWQQTKLKQLVRLNEVYTHEVLPASLGSFCATCDSYLNCYAFFRLQQKLWRNFDSSNNSWMQMLLRWENFLSWIYQKIETCHDKCFRRGSLFTCECRQPANIGIWKSRPEFSTRVSYIQWISTDMSNSVQDWCIVQNLCECRIPILPCRCSRIFNIYKPLVLKIFKLPQDILVRRQLSTGRPVILIPQMKRASTDDLGYMISWRKLWLARQYIYQQTCVKTSLDQSFFL